MKFALVNPPWTFAGSVYFGCREPHLPLELGYARALLEAAGQEAAIIDGHLFGLSPDQVVREVERSRPDVVVVTTAPGYLFWRCPPPELRVPAALIRALAGRGAKVVAVGPHGSATPRAVLAKTGAAAVIRGEFEEVLPLLAQGVRDIPGLCRAGAGEPGTGLAEPVRMENLPALSWPGDWLRRHPHHHHRFDTPPQGPGAEIEASRGCPYQCSFCAKENFRGPFRKRPLAVVLAELDGLLAHGVEYVYFIDEIFLPDRPLLEALASRPVTFGVQTRIDLWRPGLLALLGAAGCVSIEAGVESVTPEGRQRLNKPGVLSSEELASLLITAKRHVPFVQANLVRTPDDDPQLIAAWRERLRAAGVWANDPVPLFVYPGSPAYRSRWGEPDDGAWERAHAFYLGQNGSFCDFQEAHPLPLPELEQPEYVAGGGHG